MAQFKFTFKEVLIKECVVDIPCDDMSDEQRVRAALNEARRMYFEEKVVLLPDDCQERTVFLQSLDGSQTYSECLE